MFPIPLPWIVISATIALFGTYQVGHHYGWLERDEEMQIEIAKKNEEARELEKNMTSKLADKETALRKAKNANTFLRKYFSLSDRFSQSLISLDKSTSSAVQNAA